MMALFHDISDRGVAGVLKSYPVLVQQRLLKLRALVFETAAESEEIGVVTETLKWGQLSYLTKNGSTLRMGWDKKYPEEYAMYFHCQTILVDTFKEIYPDLFRYEGNRAIVIRLDEEPAEAELKHCISMSLNYHRLKHLSLLGG